MGGGADCSPPPPHPKDFSGKIHITTGKNRKEMRKGNKEEEEREKMRKNEEKEKKMEK